MIFQATDKPIGLNYRTKGIQYFTDIGEASDGTGKSAFDTIRVEAGDSYELSNWDWLQVVEYEG